jgi:hypothetical protein
MIYFKCFSVIILTSSQRRGQENVDRYIHSPIRLHGVVLISLSTGTTLPFTLEQRLMVTCVMWCEIFLTPSLQSSFIIVVVSLAYLFLKVKVGLCDHHAVCVSVYPIQTLEFLNQASRNLVCILWHLSPSQRRDS